MGKRFSMKYACLWGALVCVLLFVSCSDDDNNGGNSGGEEISIPASVIDGVRVSGISSTDVEGSFSVDYNDDGTPASATVAGQTFDFEYEPVTRAAVPTGKKLVKIGARNPEEASVTSSWVATNFAFNTDGFVASYQEVINESGDGYSSKVVFFLTFDYNNKGQLQRVGITGTENGIEDGERYSEHISTELKYVYSGDALESASNTYDGETISYTYEYGTDTHANTYNVMTPQLAKGMAVYSPILYALANMGYMGNASAFLPTKCTYRSYSDYGDGDPDYDEKEEYDISYRFWDDNSFDKIRDITTTMPNGYGYTYSYTYFDK